MTAHAVHPVPAVASALREALAERGLRRSLGYDARCVLQWAPFTRVLWPRALAGVS